MADLPQTEPLPAVELCVGPDGLPSYQALLDAALEASFPASDPPAHSAAGRVEEPRTTARDCHDWALASGGCPAVGQACDRGEGRDRSVRRPARLTARSDLEGFLLPAGPYELEQTRHVATLHWHTPEGSPRAIDLPVQTLQRLLAEGRLVRDDDVPA